MITFLSEQEGKRLKQRGHPFSTVCLADLEPVRSIVCIEPRVYHLKYKLPSGKYLTHVHYGPHRFIYMIYKGALSEFNINNYEQERKARAEKATEKDQDQEACA